ncbi:TonB-dependent receptor [Pelomonas sp. SE-A7]|uniref:TonB-dependent receptor plug domain-containing protein n=1 Tax=Pelomonas sp. SE-A7 TaxID=3054953 RepID=UPI00259C7723|nr:TonB-dependent receptor [Pelomonas sp. SE-A7]MDM4764485.1 TonB-dependent receptor [Pelomonas sp. SE-A7]
MRTRRTPEAAPLLALCLLLGGMAQAQTAAPAAEQDQSLEELLKRSLPGAARRAEVSTASRFAQSADRAPALTYVVTADDIRNHGYRNLGDVLNSLPGLYLTYNGTFTFIGARGLGRPGDFNARLLVLIDGMRINENIYDAAQVGPEFQLDASLIERVEFTPGPGSAVYGNNAFFGVVQVFTKRLDKLGGTQLGLSLGNDHSLQGRGSYGRRLEDGGDWWLAASSSIQRQLPLMLETRRLDRGALRHRQWDRTGKLAFGWSSGAFDLHAGVAERRLGLADVLLDSEPPVYVQGRDLVRSSYLSLKYEGSLGPEWDWELRASSQRSLYHRDTPFASPDGGMGTFRGRALGRWNGAELKLATQRWAGQRWLFGLEAQHDLVQRLSYGVLGQPFIQESWGQDRRIGAYLQDELSLAENQELVIGWRYDDSRYAAGAGNPRLAWVWRPNENASLKLLHGNAYRAANLFEFDINMSVERDKPSPERIRSTELAWEQALDGGGLQYSLAVHHSRLRDLITLNADEFTYDNRSQVRNRGLDIGIDQRWSGGTQVSALLSVQRSRDQDGQALSNSPVSLLKTRWVQPLAGPWQLAWQLLAMSERQAGAIKLAGHAVQHLNLLWRPDAQTEWSLGVYNLLDKRYYDRTDPDGPPLLQERRSLRLSLVRRLP